MAAPLRGRIKGGKAIAVPSFRKWHCFPDLEIRVTMNPFVTQIKNFESLHGDFYAFWFLKNPFGDFYTDAQVCALQKEHSGISMKGWS
jgi:hypothetical protein